MPMECVCIHLIKRMKKQQRFVRPSKKSVANGFLLHTILRFFFLFFSPFSSDWKQNWTDGEREKFVSRPWKLWYEVLFLYIFIVVYPPCNINKICSLLSAYAHSVFCYACTFKILHFQWLWQQRFSKWKMRCFLWTALFWR